MVGTSFSSAIGLGFLSGFVLQHLHMCRGEVDGLTPL